MTLLTLKNIIDLESIADLNNSHPAKKYLLDRLIPETQLSRIFYADKFKTWVNTKKKTFDSLHNDQPRIIIPLTRTDGSWYGIQGRSMAKYTTLRYITVLFDEHEKVFGLDKVNTDETVYVTEGPLDSLFLDNAIAMCGADVDLSSYDYDLVYVYDNEPRNKQIVARMENSIQQGNKMVIWPSVVKCKDINDMVLAGLDPSAIISEHVYHGLEAKLKLTNWKKV